MPLVKRTYVPWVMVLLGWAGGAGLACVIDTVPFPEDQRESQQTPGDGDADDTAAPDTAGVIDTSRLYYSAAPVLLVGLPEAVPNDSAVQITSPAHPAWEARRAAAADGSFNIALDFPDASDPPADHPIDITVLRANTPLASVRIHTDARGAGGSPTSSSDGSSEASGGSETPTSPPVLSAAARNDDTVDITAPAGSFSPGATVVLANTHRGTTQATQAQNDGSLTYQLAGASGERLIVFAVAASGGPAGGAPITLDVS